MVLDLDVTYSGEAYLGVSIMKVIHYDKICDIDDDYNDEYGHVFYRQCCSFDVYEGSSAI